VGDVLVAINPFKSMDELYSARTAAAYLNVQAEGRVLPPHIFNVSDRAYGALLRDGHSQVCVISGESGAGKTESAKLFVRQVILLASGVGGGGGSDTNNASSPMGDGVEPGRRTVEARIQMVNPILEAFGNASTVMNHNSSRFGKFMELKLSATGQVRGATLSHYLLEKSRVVLRGYGEGNYHVFGYLCDGLPEVQLRRMQLLTGSHPSPFAYLKGHRRHQQRPGDCWKEVIEAMRNVGFSVGRCDDVQSVLAAILHLGDVSFSEGDNDGSRLESPDRLQTFAELVSVDATRLQRALMITTTEIMGEEFQKPARVDMCYNSRDATAKAMCVMCLCMLVYACMRFGCLYLCVSRCMSRCVL